MIRPEVRPFSEAEWRRAGEIVLGVAARAFCVSREQLLAKSRCQRHVAFARQVAMYLTHTVFGGTYQEAGDIFGRERTTVAYACSLVEDERDDPDLDRKLEALEECMIRLWAIDRLRESRNVKLERKGRAAA